MNAAEIQRNKIIKQVERVYRAEANVSVAIGKATKARDKLWNICPHKWGVETHEHQGRKHYTCDVCGMIMSGPRK